MIVESLKKIFKRDLLRLRKEIASYSSESNLWIIDKEIKNSGGNLCFHLIGNLKHFIGNVLGETGYKRQRELEFSASNIPKVKLIQEIDETIDIVINTLDALMDADLEEEFPIIVFKDKMNVGFFLIHLSTHLSYHLGQINYHRRLLDNHE